MNTRKHPESEAEHDGVNPLKTQQVDPRNFPITVELIEEYELSEGSVPTKEQIVRAIQQAEDELAVQYARELLERVKYHPAPEAESPVTASTADRAGVRNADPSMQHVNLKVARNNKPVDNGKRADRRPPVA